MDERAAEINMNLGKAKRKMCHLKFMPTQVTSWFSTVVMPALLLQLSLCRILFNTDLTAQVTHGQFPFC
jgi:hypothetical protein